MLQYVHHWVGTDKKPVAMCGRGTRALPDGTWKSTTGGRRPRQSAQAAKSHHGLSAAQGPAPRAAALLQMVSEHAALQRLQGKSSPLAFTHLQLCNPETCQSVQFITIDVQTHENKCAAHQRGHESLSIFIHQGPRKKLYFIARRQQWIITCFSFSSVLLTNIYFSQTSGERVWHWPHPEPSLAMHFLYLVAETSSDIKSKESVHFSSVI